MEIIIMCGIPCSGKSTWALEYAQKSNEKKYEIISRDKIREQLFKGHYIYSSDNEKKVTWTFNEYMDVYLHSIHLDGIILDNTHCKESYLNDIIKRFYNTHDIKIVFIDIPLWKAKLRNIARWYYTKKWIPISVINTMYKNYNKINKQKYEIYKI